MKTRFIIFILMVSYISVAKAESMTYNEIKQAYALCAATSAIVGSKMPEGLIKEAINGAAKRHGDMARAYGATQTELEQLVKGLVDAYNEERITWDYLTDFGMQCTQDPTLNPL